MNYPSNPVMSKRKNSRSSAPLFVAAIATLLVSSCNRGYGCPANNMSVEDGWLDLIANLIISIL